MSATGICPIGLVTLLPGSRSPPDMDREGLPASQPSYATRVSKATQQGGFRRSMTTLTKPTTRVCVEPGCPQLVTAGTRCADHAFASRGRPYRRASEHVMSATHCAVCGEPFTDERRPTRGHIVARANGGTDSPENFQAECGPCNYGKREP